jgi:hypothetical protein
MMSNEQTAARLLIMPRIKNRIISCRLKNGTALIKKLTANTYASVKVNYTLIGTFTTAVFSLDS